MIIVTDSAADLFPSQKEGLDIHYVPLKMTLDEKTYTSGIDIQSDEFYHLLEATDSFPTTSQPSPGDFSALYERLAEIDPEILSIHISSGLSGTLEAARLGAGMVPKAKVTFFDSKTLSAPLGWMVEAAARALRKNWTLSKILEMLTQIQAQTYGIYTVKTLKYLIHGGRISHLRGLVASMLSVKPIIGIDKMSGKYISLAQEMTFKRSIRRIPEIIAKTFPPGSRLRVQLLHGQNLEGVEMLKDAMRNLFDCHFDPVTFIAPVLGAHTGPSIVGLAVGNPDVFSEVFA